MPFIQEEDGEEPPRRSDVVPAAPPARVPARDERTAASPAVAAGAAQGSIQRPMAAGAAAPRAAAPEPARIASIAPTDVRSPAAGRIAATPLAPMRASGAPMSPVQRAPAPDPVLRERWAPGGAPGHVARFVPSRPFMPLARPPTGGSMRDEAESSSVARRRATAHRRSARASRGRVIIASGIVALALALAAACRWAGWPARGMASTASAPVVAATVPAAGCPSGAGSAATDATAQAFEDLPPTAAGSQAPGR